MMKICDSEYCYDVDNDILMMMMTMMNMGFVSLSLNINLTNMWRMMTMMKIIIMSLVTMPLTKMIMMMTICEPAFDHPT